MPTAGPSPAPPQAIALLRGAVLVTGNRGKLREARRLIGASLAAAAIDLPEIQSLDLRVVLAAKADEAFRRLGRPVIVEETGLELAALGGFPGPLVKWMVAATGVAGVARTAHALGDARATARGALMYFDGERRLLGEGAVAGDLVLPPRGAAGFGWDAIFRPAGATKTYAEMAAAEKDAISQRAQAWRRLAGACAAAR